MNLVILVLLTALAAAERPLISSPVIAILRNEQHTPDAFGNHNSDFETQNGIEVHISGSQGPNGGANMIGTWRQVLNFGTLHGLLKT